MSFFGKLKNLHGPPVPPKRIDDNAENGWPEDEFDDDEGDMYEAPPCERPVAKVQPRPVEENVYLERSSNPVVPQRQAAPPPRPFQMSRAPQVTKKTSQHELDFGVDSQIKKPPEVDRKEKPGKKPAPRRTDHPPPFRPPPFPTPASNFEEDVYLDPNEEQDDSDDLYLEPEAACPTVPQATQRLFPKSAAPPPIPIMKPPVPRAMSSSHLPLFSEQKTTPPPDARRPSVPGRMSPSSSGVKPPLLLGMLEVKPSMPLPPILEPTPAASKQTGNENQEWFPRNFKRKTAEDLLLRVNRDGAFLIRHSSTQSTGQPYTLAVLYSQKVYNIPIRYMEEMQGYALGKEGKQNEEIFSNLQEIISHHKNNQLLLIDSRSQAKHTTYLTHPAYP